MSHKENNPFVRIASAIGGCSIAIVVLVAVLARQDLMVAVWIIGILALMGVVLGAMALKKDEK